MRLSSEQGFDFRMLRLTLSFLMSSRAPVTKSWLRSSDVSAILYTLVMRPYVFSSKMAGDGAYLIFACARRVRKGSDVRMLGLICTVLT